jgi:hypothetical protein
MRGLLHTQSKDGIRECFGRFRHRWLTWQIDSRTARLTNKPQIERWVQDYGEDSDFVRIRVLRIGSVTRRKCGISCGICGVTRRQRGISQPTKPWISVPPCRRGGASLMFIEKYLCGAHKNICAVQ